MTNDRNNSAQAALATAVYRILKALARVSIRYGMSAGAMTELVRKAFLEAAEESLVADGQKPLTSRLCAMTGLYRKEIVRLQSQGAPEQQPQDDRYNRSARVITGWVRDPDFHTPSGKPAALKLQGPASFAELVKRYSGDMTPVAMRRELERLGSISITSRNLVRLETRGFLASDEIDALQILGTDTADLVSTIHHNISCEKEERWFQRKVSYVHIPQRYVEEFREHTSTESQLLLEKLDKWLAEHDVEDQSGDGKGSKLGLGVYHIEYENTVKKSPDND